MPHKKKNVLIEMSLYLKVKMSCRTLQQNGKRTFRNTISDLQITSTNLRNKSSMPKALVRP